SERALAYSDEPLVHRMLVFCEASGMDGDMQTYLVRTLLSEGRLRYETVEKTVSGLQTRLVEREGPTGLITTTTAISLHQENEPRLLTVTIDDTPDQTRRVLEALGAAAAGVAARAGAELGEWQALQRWLEYGERGVVIPFAQELSARVPAAAVR